MPIPAEIRRLYYGVVWRTIVRPRILARAGNCCEQCNAPNRQTVLRTFGWWTPANFKATVFMYNGQINGEPVTELEWHAAGTSGLLGFPRSKTMHWVGIVLTIAHLNHQPGDDRDENLRALCQWCHLHYDQAVHLVNSKQTRLNRKDGSRPLLIEETHP